MLGYRLVKEDVQRRFQLELDHLRGRSRKFDDETAELKRLAAGKGEALERMKEHTIDARGRAEQAEAMVQLQAKSIERLMASNERMVKLVADMRRVGFGILEPIETNDTPNTTAEYDREAVTRDRALAADDD